MNNPDFKNKVNSILMVQLQDHLQGKPVQYTKEPPRFKPAVKVFANALEPTHFLALKISTLLPSSQALLEAVGKHQELLIGEFGQGVLGKVAEPQDLYIKLLGIKESIPNALSIAMSNFSLDDVELLVNPVVDFSAISSNQDYVYINAFSTTLLEVINAIHDHCFKTPGIEVAKLESSSQSGLFKLEILDILSAGNFTKPTQKVKFGKFSWSTLNVVNSTNNTVFANINISMQE